MLLTIVPGLLLAWATLCQSAAVVEHSLDGRTFQQIGLIHLEDDFNGNQPIVTGTYERQPFTDNQRQQLQQLVEQDRLYLWRVQLEGQPAVLTSIKASCLAQNFGSQAPILNLNSAGQIVSAQLSVPSSVEGTCSSSKALQSLQQLSQDAMREPEPLKVVVHTPKAAPSVPRFPPLAEAPADPYAAAGAAKTGQPAQQQARRPPGQQSSDGEQQTDADAAQQTPPPDNHTWWQKNWLFVMAGGTMVLNMALKAAAGDMPQPGQPGAPGPGAARQARGAARR